eukprot:CAMPEP_0181365432 /NCGR_PEP_ID=MMETSP1106-20121128/10062_1 /TAXON_ID=81844 /ORGANISM="Mantoniella antarctica, Strain SL-175" /LENGTH=63 /DNA_ID=CAMNT_0023480503 /DNA_START=849 /DNA_END=1040 /DNA_ORIENTATION=-
MAATAFEHAYADAGDSVAAEGWVSMAAAAEDDTREGVAKEKEEGVEPEAGVAAARSIHCRSAA